MIPNLRTGRVPAQPMRAIGVASADASPPSSVRSRTLWSNTNPVVSRNSSPSSTGSISSSPAGRVVLLLALVWLTVAVVVRRVVGMMA